MLRALAAGGASAAVFTAALWVPPVGLFSPLPLAVIAWRKGALGAIIGVAAAALVVGLLAGPVGVVVYVSQFAAGACALGLALRAGRGPLRVVGSYAALSALGFLGYAVAVGIQAGNGPGAFLDETVRQTVDQLVKLLAQSSADPETTLAVQEGAAEAKRVLPAILPGLYLAWAVLTGWLNALLARRTARHPGQEPWSGWRAPEAWIWVLIASGLVGVTAGGTLRAVAFNVFAVMVVVYFLHGLAVVQHLFEARHLAPGFRALAYVFLFLQLPAMFLVAGLGAFDLWFDFRKRWSPRPPEQGVQP